MQPTLLRQWRSVPCETSNEPFDILWNSSLPYGTECKTTFYYVPSSHREDYSLDCKQKPIFVMDFTSSSFSSKHLQGIRLSKKLTSVCSSPWNNSYIFPQSQKDTYLSQLQQRLEFHWYVSLYCRPLLKKAR